MQVERIEGLGLTSVTPTYARLLEAAAEVTPIASDEATRIVEEMRGSDRNQRVHVLEDAPKLGRAALKRLQRSAEDLEALITQLQADIEEAQRLAEKRHLESLLGQLKAEHGCLLEEIRNTIAALQAKEK